jgi:hypothetical protein
MVIHQVYRPMGGQRLAGPHRAVNWRQQRAVDLVAEDRAPSRRLDDRVVTLLSHFYRRRRDCRSVHDRERLANAMPHVSSAARLHEEAPAGFRTVVEALVLANQSRERIAASVGMTEEAIEVFELGFFDVRDRLANSPFIIESVIRLHEADVDSQQFASAAVKLLSYYAGPACVGLLMIPRGDQWISIREVASRFARRARILLHLGTNRGEWLADPRGKQEMLRAIEAIEAWPGEFGDEGIPRTEPQLLEAKRQTLDNLLMDRLRGGHSESREGRNV